jgi:hypothetical protein
MHYKVAFLLVFFRQSCHRLLIEQITCTKHEAGTHNNITRSSKGTSLNLAIILVCLKHDTLFRNSLPMKR